MAKRRKRPARRDTGGAPPSSPPEASTSKATTAPSTDPTPADPAPAPPAIAEAAAPSAPARSLTPPWLADALGGAVLVLALLGADPDLLARFPVVWDLGRLLAGLAAALWLVGRRLPAARGPLPLAAAAAAAGLALVALYGRDPGLVPTPFAGANPAILGLPSVLPLLLLAVGALALRAPPAPLPNAPDTPSPDDAPPSPLRVARAVFAVGLLWSTWVLLVPDFDLGAARHPLVTAALGLTSGEALPTLAGLTRLTAAVATAAAWVFAVRAVRGVPFALPPRIATLGLAAAVAFHALAGVAIGAPLPGLLVAATLALAAAAARALVARPPAPNPRAGRALDAALLTAVLAVFVLLKTHGMGPSNTDENIYFYMAAELTHGRWPYVDYFFAHPPLHVLVPGVFFVVFGYSLALAKIFSVAAAAIAGAAVFAIARRHLGRAAAVLAAVLFLFAAETLKASSNMTGVNLTTMWLTLGLWQFLRGRPLTAGLLFGAAATTGFYAMAAVMAALTLGLFRWPDAARRARERFAFGLRQIVGFALVFGGINLIFLAAAGDAFTEGVYSYHGLKALRDPRMVDLFGGDLAFPLSLFNNIGAMVDGKEFTKELYYHAHLWIGLFAAPVVGAAAYFTHPERRRRALAFFAPTRLFRDGPHGVAALVWLVALALFAQFAMFRELYSFYFVLIYPTLALVTAYAVVHAGAVAASALSGAPPGRLAGARLAAAALALAVVSAHVPWSMGLQGVFGDELDATGARNDYVWTEAPALPALSNIVRATFWEDYRVKGDGEPGYRHYLWTKKRTFSTLDAIADAVRERSAPDETIAGASTTTPIIALAAGRRIAADEVDTNNKRFRTGLLDDETYWRAICADNVRLIIATPRSYFTRERMDSLPTARRWFRLVRVFEDHELSYAGHLPIALYERVGDAPGPGEVCRWEP